MSETPASLDQPLCWLSVLYGIVIIGVFAVIVTALRRVQTGHSTTLRDIFKQTRFLELTTVLVIIVSGTYLALLDKLSQGVVALLSGIAGYVLGGLGETKGAQEIPPPTPTKTDTRSTQPGA